MPLTRARALSPSTEGKPRKSALTIATLVLSSANTNARTVKSPSCLLTGLDGPTPPETGNSGSGVTTRTAIPARNSALVHVAANKRSKTGRRILVFMTARFSHRTRSATIQFRLRLITAHRAFKKLGGDGLVPAFCQQPVVFRGRAVPAPAR